MAVRNAFFRRLCVRRVALEQNLAADAVRFCSEPALTTPLAIANDAVDGRQCLFRLARLRLRLGQRGHQKWNVVADILLSASRDSGAHFGKNGVSPVRAAPRPRRKEFSVRRPHLHFVRACDVDESFNVGRRCGRAPPEHFKYREVEMRVADGNDVAGANCARQSLLGNGARLIDFPQHPQHQRKVCGNGYADVRSETKRLITMTLRIENGTRTFEKSARRGEIPGEPFSRAVDAKGNDGFWRIRPIFDFAQSKFRDFPQRRQFAANEVTRPKGVLNRKALRRIIGSGGQFLGPAKGPAGFRRLHASTMQEGAAVSGLELVTVGHS